MNQMQTVSKNMLVVLLCFNAIAVMQASHDQRAALSIATSMMSNNGIRGTQSSGPEEYDVVHPAGSQGAAGPAGAAGVNGTLGVFLYWSTDGIVTVADGDLVPTTINVGQGIYADIDTFTIPDDGFYFLTYSASRYDGNQIDGVSFEVQRDDGSIGGSSTYNGSWSGIVPLLAGNVISLKNILGSSIDNVYVVFSIVQLTSELLIA